jgi:hypothetical protein
VAFRSVALLPLVLGGALSAQSLTLSAAAASPERDDSIYALRVDSAAFRGHDDVFLLDDATVRVEADGRYTYTLHRVIQLLTTKGVENWGEMTFWYNKDRQRATINHILVVGPDGSILQRGPAHQEEVNPPANQGAPTFSDRRGIQVTLAGLAPGTLIDYSYTSDKIKPALAGDFSYVWDVNGDPPIRRSRFTFDTPVGLNARVRVRNLAGAPTDTVMAGRRIRRWLVADVPGVKRESYSGTPNAVQAWIWVSGDVTWRNVGQWYDSLSRGRFQLTDSILAAQAQQLKGAKSLTDSLRATYRWVAQDFRYVSLSLGDGSYQPRTPREVFESRFGDCKDKATLFVALARRLGVTAYPVLLSAYGGVDSLQPSLSQFDHMIAAVTYGGTTRYLDLTDPLLPYGQLELREQGDVGLALPASGPRVVVFPATPADSNWHDLEVAGAFAPDGRFIGRLTLTATGTEQGDLRGELAGLGQKEASDRAQQIRKHVTALWTSAAVDSQRYGDGHDLGAPVNLTVWFTAARVIGQVDGGKYYFNLPIGRFIDADDVDRLKAEGPRRYSIDIGRVNSPSVYRTGFEVELPEGWRAELPQDVSVQGPFGYYRARFSQTGRVLRVSREMGGGRGILPPDSVKALRTWLQAVEADRTAMIVLSRGTGVDMVAAGTAPSTITSGTLPDIVLGAADVSNDAKVTQEGLNSGSSDFLTVSSTRPLESYHRSFGPRQVVFPAGGSRLMVLEAYASAYHSAPEARWMIDALNMFDLRRFLDAFVRQEGLEQARIDSIRPLPVQGIGDRSAGWLFEVVTPINTLDLGMAVATRGRVAESVLAIGPKGMQDSDVTALLRQMDDRVRHQDAYSHDVTDESPDTEGVAAVDSALRAATPLALNTIAVPPPDSTGSTVRDVSFRRDNGWPQYTTTITGKAFTFPFGRSGAIEISTVVTEHNSPAEAVQQVVAAQRASRTAVMQTAIGDVAGFGSVFVDSVWLADTTTLEPITLLRIGSWSEARHARLRGVLRTDLDDIVFARGRLSVRIEVTRPHGESDVAAVATLANDILRRMRAVDPEGGEAPPAPSLVATVTRVVDADHEVDSLAEAKNIDAAFQAVDAAPLRNAPVTLNSSTWNSLCWWASLEGQAKRAQAACDAAVAPDTTDLAIRDSRGLQRALAGDLNGARDDFAYIVANVVSGTFKDLRSEWLSALRAGQNPFTPAVLEQLRK